MDINSLKLTINNLYHCYPQNSIYIEMIRVGTDEFKDSKGNKFIPEKASK